MNDVVNASLHASSTHPFSVLTPGVVIDAVEAHGFFSDGRILALNSYENRVYQVGIEGAPPMIAKFYRPQRWTREQVLEEHQFCFELAQHDWPVVTAWQNAQGESLFEHASIAMALFTRRGGRAPELDNFEHLYQLGQAIAQLHGVGRQKSFAFRPRLDVQSYGDDSVAYVLKHFIPPQLRVAYESLCSDLLSIINARFAAAGDVQWVRCHGDCHLGNILWRDDAPNFVDFDDARMAPAVQDIWMLLSGDRAQQTAQLQEVIEGYELFQEFNRAELALIEPLRTLRMLHYCAWLARRWEDPIFPMHFPWFNSERYWGEHILELREQFAILHESPLSLF